MVEASMEAKGSVKRALISVYDKTGIVPFAMFLANHGVEIVSTGGTAKVLKEAGIDAIELSEYTGYPEMLGGRVKTLHPKVHAGLLYIRGNDKHEATVRKHRIGSIDMLVVNFYPFEEIVKKQGATHEEIMENIDIGGPAMLRSASKNYESVAIITDPEDYRPIIEEIKTQGGITAERRKELAGKAFGRIAAYDIAIANYFGQKISAPTVEVAPAPVAPLPPPPPTPKMDKTFAVSSQLVQNLRYGENPHQKAALYGNWNDYYRQLQGKELSYNNILDLTEAAELIAEFSNDPPTVAILKHTNPCGVGQGKDLHEAWHKALDTDRKAPFGGIIAANQEIDKDAANAIKEIFSEVIVAPSYSAEALKILGEKKNLRLMQVLKDPRTGSPWRLRSVGADSFVMQETDTKALTAADFKIVTKRQPTAEELRAMLFAWRIVKHVKSNAIVYAGPDRTLGIGAGQMSRVDSSRIAVWKAGEAGLNLGGSVVASDAFFPFPDALLAAAEAGVTAVIQPGGSIKDEEIIAVADARGMAMAFTNIRHFRH
jgi:phosphoribosylaminoimidazolecarboxamide formyltransferase/IMP cyclohydrolase